MSQYGETPDARTVRFERTLPGPIGRVWDYITDPDKRATWLAGGIVEDKAGGTVEMVFRNAKLSGDSADTPERYQNQEGMRFSGEVTRYEPPSVFAHTWDGTELVFELSETYDGRVRLVLTQTAIADSDERLGVLAGWHTHLDFLEARLDDREPGSFWTLHETYDQAYRKREATPD